MLVEENLAESISTLLLSLSGLRPASSLLMARSGHSDEFASGPLLTQSGRKPIVEQLRSVALRRIACHDDMDQLPALLLGPMERLEMLYHPR